MPAPQRKSAQPAGVVPPPSAVPNLDEHVHAILADTVRRQEERSRAGTDGLGWSPEERPAGMDRHAERFSRLERYGVPYREALLVMDEDPAGEAFVDTPSIVFARSFLQHADAGRRNVLVISGPVGTGKTVASVFVIDTAAPPLRYGRTWGAAPRMFRQASDLVALGLYEKDDVRAALASAPVLVMDDLGAEYVDKSGVYLCFLDWLLDKRYGGAGYTVLTTNLDASAFRAEYGERLYDRLRHRADWYDVAGKSLRGNVE